MAFVSYVDLDPAQEEQFFRGLTPDSRFLYAKVKKKTGLFSAKKKKSLSLRSMLPQISELWAGLSAGEKTAWTTAGGYAVLNGWRAFVAEQSIRLKLGLSVPGASSIYHNSWYGHLSIGGSATQIKIAQYHPAGYYVHRKVAGFKKVYAPVFVQESIGLPLQIGISYKANLSAVSWSAPVLLSSYSESNYDDSFYLDSADDGRYRGQSFLNVDQKNLDSCKFYLKTTNGYRPTGGLRAYLYAHTGTYGSSSGLPTGAPLATSDLVSGASLPTSLSLVSFTFSGAQKIVLSASTHYCIILKNINDDGVVQVGSDTSSSSASGSTIHSNDGSTWYADASGFVATIFYVYGVSPISSYAKFYAVVLSSYQGVDRENIVEINFTNDNAWHIATATLSSSLGYVFGYTLYIHIFGYTGDFYFDHVKAIHGSVNWARDKNCYDINVAFTNQYYQVPKNWAAIELPAGSVYDSDYIDGI
jgi:hypothetical protein